VYGLEGFKQLILFFSNYIYSTTQFLAAGPVEAEPSLVLVEEQLVDSSVFSFEIRDFLFEATVFKLAFGVSCLDQAATFAVKNLLKPATGSWSDAFKSLYLGD
jgi:hypothetical protein